MVEIILFFRKIDINVLIIVFCKKYSYCTALKASSKSSMISSIFSVPIDRRIVLGLIHSSLLFATAKSMLKVMDGELLNAAKRTVQATKLSEDELIEVIPIDWMEGSEDKVVLQTKEGVFLKFLLSEIPKKKKSALGVRGMKLSKDDSLTNIYVMAAQNISSIVYKEKELEFHRLKLSKRDSKGTKVRR